MLGTAAFDRPCLTMLPPQFLQTPKFGPALQPQPEQIHSFLSISSDSN